MAAIGANDPLTAVRATADIRPSVFLDIVWDVCDLGATAGATDLLFDIVLRVGIYYSCHVGLLF